MFDDRAVDGAPTLKKGDGNELGGVKDIDVRVGFLEERRSVFSSRLEQ